MMNLRRSKSHVWTLVFALAATTAGCASKGYVRGNFETLHERDREIESSVERTQTRLEKTDQRLTGELASQEQRLGAVSETAGEALERAVEAGKLAQGKLLYEAVLADDYVRFGFEKAELSDEAKTALDELGKDLVARNENVYLEIQGHTDSSGPEEYNHKLGEERAEAVRRYLNMEYRIPLHRMATISYGESAPVADNHTREGRAKNRRVVVVVLQ